MTDNRTTATNYHRLFGTPEKAAQTLTHVCQFTHGSEHPRSRMHGRFGERLRLVCFWGMRRQA